MQVEFSTLFIALNLLNLLFRVVITSPIPTPAGSRHGTPVGLPVRPPSLSDQSQSSSPSSSPVHTQASPATKQEWHQERARKWGKHTKETGARVKEFGNDAIKAAGQGNIQDAVKNAGKSCVMGIICGGAAAVKAVHKHKANKPVN